jgi:ubiquinone/menaquinone biosynthesis C-methylase UbiE
MPLVYKEDYFETFGEKYDNISQRDFDFIKANQPGLRPDGVMLDLACGSGAMGERFVASMPGLRAIGADLSRPLLQWSHMPTCQADVAQLPFKTDSVDHIIAAAAFHHFPSVERVIQECARCLKTGGGFAAYDPNLFHPQRLLMMTKPLRTIFYRIGDRAMSPIRFKAMLANNGFRQIRITYFAFEGLKTGLYGRINFKITNRIKEQGLNWLMPFVAPWYLISAVKTHG